MAARSLMSSITSAPAATASAAVLRATLTVVMSRCRAGLNVEVQDCMTVERDSRHQFAPPGAHDPDNWHALPFGVPSLGVTYLR